MGKDPTPYTPAPVRRLFEAEPARVLELLSQLDTEAMFAEEPDRILALLWSGRLSVRTASVARATYRASGRLG